ncbi:MAG: hypothetical protein A2163_04005 [Actinobacteria bacterium RBG_13_35_12]|nr:MAG: hypothetical protein A2163_04005 [Actinobacteria bacterium RBG_13_35_12]
MSDGNRFEDKVSIEDLMKKSTKVLLANIYQQVLKTNGTVTQHCEDIDDINTDIDNLQTKLEEKIGMKELLRFEKMFAVIAGIAGLIIIIFNILDRVL